MIFDIIWYLMNTILGFVYQVINFPFQQFGYDIGTLLVDLKITQIFGFATDVLLPDGFVLFYFGYVSIIIMADFFLSIIDRRKKV